MILWYFCPCCLPPCLPRSIPLPPVLFLFLSFSPPPRPQGAPGWHEFFFLLPQDQEGVFTAEPPNKDCGTPQTNFPSPLTTLFHLRKLPSSHHPVPPVDPFSLRFQTVINELLLSFPSLIRLSLDTQAQLRSLGPFSSLLTSEETLYSDKKQILRSNYQLHYFLIRGLWASDFTSLWFGFLSVK